MAGAMVTGRLKPCSAFGTGQPNKDCSAFGTFSPKTLQCLRHWPLNSVHLD
jgi:hypothetical protein